MSDARATGAASVAVVGGGWAGLATAVTAVEAGCHVTLFEASHQLGGRARALPGPSPRLDNGQHILIGAYRATLGLMRQLGVDLDDALLRLPLDLRRPDGQGLCVPSWARRLPPPLPALAGVLGARGWSWADRLSLVRHTLVWQARGFRCAPHLSVAELCRRLPPRVIEQLIEPLCVSALNTPGERASAAMFLRVLGDALTEPGLPPYQGSEMLLPRADLGALLPEPSQRWLQAHGAELRLGWRVTQLTPHTSGWTLGAQAPGADKSVAAGPFDRVVLACPATAAARLLRDSPALAAEEDAQAWAACAEALPHEAIATIYLPCAQGLDTPMLALPSDASAPAQFVFDRGRLGGPAGLLAFVVSAATQERQTLTDQVLRQAEGQLGVRALGRPVTVLERRATLACTPGLRRPGAALLPGLLVAGDYVDGPYPSTLEGAVRSGLALGPTLAERHPKPLSAAE